MSNVPPPPYGDQPQQPPGQQPPPYGQQPPPPTYGQPVYGGGGGGGNNMNPLAIVSLVAGIASIICCGFGFIPGIAAVVTGIMGRKQIAESGGAQTGDGLALAGLIVGGIGILLSLFWLLANGLSYSVG